GTAMASREIAMTKPVLPESLSALSADEFKQLGDAVRAYAKHIVESGGSVEDVDEATTMYQAILAERKSRTEADAKRAALASSLDDEDEDAGEEMEETEEADAEGADAAETETAAVV